MNITELLEERAEAYGERPFLICEDTEYSFEFLREQSARVAANLTAHGVGRGDKIVLLMGNCLEFLYVFLGAGRIGAVIVPINPTLKADEIAHIVNNSEAETVITIPELGAMIPQIRDFLPNVKRFFVVGEGTEYAASFAELTKPVAEIPPIIAERNDTAALIYTSGTTGLPKGVILSHRNYISNARMLVQAQTVTPEDRFFCVLPLFHVNAQVVTILTPLMGGASVVLMKKFNPFAILPMIQKHRPTIMSAVPTIYNVMSRIAKTQEFDLSSIRTFATGAAPMPEDTYLEAQRTLKRPIVGGYGLTEATCASVVADSRHPVKWNSVGSPLPYTIIRLVDEKGVDVPFGEVGEILIAGPTVMKGYYKDPEATAEVLRDGWLHTGDLGRFDEDGYLYIVGRAKDMIIRGGQNIYPQQIEDVISRLPGVEECCVVGVEEARWGQEILAVVKRTENINLAESDVIKHCRQYLARYKCPAFVRFVDELPKTPTGKIKKVEVAASFANIAKSM
ncbi:MAG: long-chain-fatty-acid--CoA ligase [Candidatus Hydrogenedentota bacterium]